MNDNIQISEDSLLKRFKKGDYERAKASLLERYRVWQDILISADEQSVITPDDLQHCKVQAADLVLQQVKSDYEWEQLKILTVLIYLLVDADKTALPAGNPALQQQLEQKKLPHASHYIMRRIIHGASQLTYDDIDSFVRYQNLVLSSYITSVPAEGTTDPTVLEGLVSSDGIQFNLIDDVHEVNIKKSDKGEAIPAAPEPEVEPEPVETVAELQPVVITDNESKFLVNTMQYTTLRSGAEVTAASYVGKDRQHNEDASVVFPENNQIIVVDAMGGYGNGVTARDVFVESLLKSPGNIEAAVEETQQQYDEIGLTQGGVCLISIDIKPEDNGHRITLSQAGDVHAILFDNTGEVKHETVDEAIGHQVINAIIGAIATRMQRTNGWKSFGTLTKATLHAKPGWRLLCYSDGIANHFDAAQMTELAANKTAKQAIATISKEVDILMSEQSSYRDNCSIAVIDF